ncbi:23898_t:CDS:2, partial [Racocetra persica]
MVSHISLLVVIIAIKNSPLCMQSLAKYKISKELSQTIKFKYFFTTNQSSHIFKNSDLVFISGKYVVENSEPCFIIAYSSIVDNKNPNREFDMTAISVYIPHCIYSVVINREPKEVKEFIHFGAETVEYNSVTDIDYLKTLAINIITSKSSSLTKANTPSIIDLIDDDIDSTVTQPKQQLKPSLTPVKNINANESNIEVIEDDKNLQDDVDELDEEVQPKKRVKSAKGNQKKKGR